MRRAYAAFLGLALAGQVEAQAGPLTRYDSLFDQLMALPRASGEVRTVTGQVLRRDAATFTLRSGQLYILPPVGGRTVAAAFVGDGEFALQTPNRTERESLQRAFRSDSLQRQFGSLFLLFTDTTAAELLAGSGVAPAGGSPLQGKIVEEGLGYLSNRSKRYFDSNIMNALLNEEQNDGFHAVVGGARGGPFLFQVDPYEDEEIKLSVAKAGESWEDRRSVTVSQFDRAAEFDPGPIDRRRKEAFVIGNYSIDASVAKNLKFSAAATLALHWRVPAHRWFSTSLYPDLKIDSAVWEGGAPARLARGKDNPILWVETPARAEGESVPRLTVHYHGDLISGNESWYDLKTSSGWYPASVRGYGAPLASKFDLTFRTPRGFKFASIGERVSIDSVGDVVTTRWVTPELAAHATFNLGKFETLELNDPDAYPVTVFVNQWAHDQLPSAVQGSDGRIIVIPRQKDMKGAVGEDVVLSLNFFRDAYGEPPVRHFYATEITGYHGQAFPGLIQLSWATYQGFMLARGEDEAFRSHEIAHQWWGLGVSPRTYRDAWLSEGLATFSGWWYTESVLQDSSIVRQMLKRSRDDLMRRRKQAGPVWLGTRLGESDAPEDYGLVVYDKGAWVVRMLQRLMYEADSGDTRFRRMMHEFYTENRGREVGTGDFEAAVSKHFGSPMGWYFDSWVYGTGIPTYEWSHRVEEAGGKVNWTLQVDQKDVADDFSMYVPVQFYYPDGRRSRVRVLVKGPSTTFRTELPARPERVVFNEGDDVLAEVKEVRWR